MLEVREAASVSLPRGPGSHGSPLWTLDLSHPQTLPLHPVLNSSGRTPEASTLRFTKMLSLSLPHCSHASMEIIICPSWWCCGVNWNQLIMFVKVPNHRSSQKQLLLPPYVPSPSLHSRPLTMDTEELSWPGLRMYFLRVPETDCGCSNKYIYPFVTQ